jgi:hypothetical protein
MGKAKNKFTANPNLGLKIFALDTKLDAGDKSEYAECADGIPCSLRFGCSRSFSDCGNLLVAARVRAFLK